MVELNRNAQTLTHAGSLAHQLKPTQKICVSVATYSTAHLSFLTTFTTNSFKLLLSTCSCHFTTTRDRASINLARGLWIPLMFFFMASLLHSPVDGTQNESN